jgi:hypothetical protein
VSDGKRVDPQLGRDRLPNPDHGYTAYGVTLYPMGEDGDLLIAFGHHDRRRFLAACNRYARTECGMFNLTDGGGVSESDIEHGFGTFDLSPEDPDAAWAFWFAKEGQPGVIPATRWNGWL